MPGNPYRLGYVARMQGRTVRAVAETDDPTRYRDAWNAGWLDAGERL
jgi:hypothetical protein